MKKLLLLSLMLGMMTACANEEAAGSEAEKPDQNSNYTETDDTKDEQGEEQKEPVKTDEEASGETEAGEETADFQSRIPEGWDVKLPEKFPVKDGKHLTAITEEKAETVTFDFYETEEALDIDDSEAKKTGEFAGRLTIMKHPSAEAAAEEIDQTVFKDGQKVDLGHGITGYQDAGAGSLYTSWNEGRWAIITRSATQKSKENLTAAKDTVDFLEEHMMPVPKQYGQLHIDAEQKGSMAKWQKQTYVYTLEDFGGETLDWLTAFE